MQYKVTWKKITKKDIIVEAETIDDAQKKAITEKMYKKDAPIPTYDEWIIDKIRGI